MSSNWQALADKFVHDLENKGYEYVDRAASVAEELLEAVFSVVEDAEARVEELKDQAAQGGAGSKALRDFWKGFTDEVAKQSSTAAPVQKERTLLDRAREDYDWLKTNVDEWKHHEGKDYWATYYTQSWDEDVTTERLNEIISSATKHRAKQDHSF